MCWTACANKWCQIFFHHNKFDRAFLLILWISKSHSCCSHRSNFFFIPHYKPFRCWRDDRIADKCLCNDVYRCTTVNLEFDSMVSDFHYCVNFLCIARFGWAVGIYSADCCCDACNEINLPGVGVGVG